MSTLPQLGRLRRVTVLATVGVVGVLAAELRFGRRHQPALVDPFADPKRRAAESQRLSRSDAVRVRRTRSRRAPP